MSRSPVLALLAALTAAVLLVACDSDEAPAMPSATPSAVATTEATRAPITPTPGATRPPVDREQQVVIFDLDEHSFTELLSPLTDADDLYFATEIFPRFTPDGAHVWIGERNALVSRRYDIEGDSVTTLAGIRVQEEDEGRLSYVQTGGDERVVKVRLGGEEFPIRAAAPSGRIVLSPDGEHIAYWARDAGEAVSYEVAEVRTGVVIATASTVGLCQCDGGPPTYWSPSGRYLVFPDYPTPISNTDDVEQGTFALDMVTGERILLSRNPWLGEGTSLGGDQFLAEREGSLVVLDAPSNASIRTIAPIEEGVHFTAAGGVAVTYDVTRDPYTVNTRAYDVESAALLDTWRGQVRPVAIEMGVAYERQTGGSTLVHPLLSEPHAFPEGFVLSPDGRHVAAAEGSAINIYRVEAAGLELIASYERSVAEQALGPTLPIEWNAEGTHLLISIGFGM